MLTALPEDKRPDFLLTIEFPPHVKNPQRIFAAASSCIAALQACDNMLLKSFPTNIRPVFLLEEVETGSIKIWLKQALEAIDDDALKSLDWKPAVGKYLVRGKYYLIKALEGKKTLPTRDELSNISTSIHTLAQETDALKLPAYSRVNEVDIAEHMKIISEALSNLKNGESLSYIGDDGCAVIDSGLTITDEDINNLLVERTIENTNELFLMVRKPDFLGETKWDFRFNRRTLSAPIVDRKWLSRFQSGEIDIRPGDALHVIMKETVSYDIRGEVVSEEHEIIQVKGVHREKEQHSLL